MLHTPLAGQVRTNPKPQKTIAERMADDLVDLAAEGDATGDRLRQRGWTPFEVETHGPSAQEIAGTQIVRRRDRYSYDRPERIKEAARLIGNLVPSTQEICAALQSRSFTKPELDDILPDAIASAADAFAHAGGAQ
jgi:hypothetical protein|tara:strand:+ start:65969 stop:66376 length:408 start_codon:yes stop_codon:yes gene_type:complete